MITIHLPFIVKSKSNNYRRGRGSFYKSKEMEEQEELMIRAITSSIPSSHTIYTNPLKVTITLTYNDKRRRDLDGAAKAILDCMNGLVYKDDSLIHVLIMSKTIGCPKASTTITVEVL